MAQVNSSKGTTVNTVPAVARLVDWYALAATGEVQTVLDYGCGQYRKLVQYLESLGIFTAGYDINHCTALENAKALSRRYSAVVMSNVLNVIDSPSARLRAIRQAYDRVLPGGFLFITVYEGNADGKGAVSKADCWQENRKTGSYAPEVADALYHQVDIVRKGRLITVRKPEHGTESMPGWALAEVVETDEELLD